MKKLFLFLVALGLNVTVGWAGDTGLWTNVCPDPEVDYCKDSGKTAYDYRGMFKLGQIIGVTWRSTGTATTGDKDRDSRERVYYYIIDDGTGSPSFIRPCDDVTAK